MTWTVALCLTVGCIVLGAGGIALMLLIVVSLLNYSLKQTKNLHLVIQWAMDKQGRERVKQKLRERERVKRWEREQEACRGGEDD